jgi:hypothetical protein
MSVRDDLADAEKALADPKVKSYTYKNRTYTLTQLRDQLIPSLKKAVEQERLAQETAETETAIAQNKIDSARERVRDLTEIRNRNRNAFRKNNLSEDEYNASEQRLAEAEADLNKLLGAQGTATQPVSPAEEARMRREAVGSRVPGPSVDAAEEARMRGEAFAGRVPVAGPGDAAPSAAAETTAKITRKDVTNGLIDAGLPDTPANRKMIREQLTTGKKPAAAGYQPGWEDEVRRQYGQYAWMLDDLDRSKYKDVFDLLAEAVNPETKLTDELFKTRFEATSWYQELATQQMGRKVRSAVGALSFNPANYAKLLSNAMRFGWEGDNLKAEAYREVFRKNDDGTFANPNAVGEARKSNDYLGIKAIGNAFLSPMSDDRIVDTLTGKTTQDDLLRIYREKAKVNNPHLAQAIDAGVTLEDIAYDYRKAASDVLGVPLAGIPLTEDFLGSALKAGEPGKYRVMTTNEWKYQLKSNPDYGYQFTGNARKEVNDIVSDLEKAFGFVR